MKADGIGPLRLWKRSRLGEHRCRGRTDPTTLSFPIDQRRLMLAMIRDITERKRAEAASAMVDVRGQSSRQEHLERRSGYGASDPSRFAPRVRFRVRGANTGPELQL